MVLLWAAGAGTARAVEHWESMGPYYEPPYPVVNPQFLVSGSAFYVTSDSGVFQSSEGQSGVARVWTRTGRGMGLFSTLVRSFVADPSTPSTIYAGTSGGGVYKTVDGGRSWSPRNSGLESLVVQVLARVAGSPGTIYAGTLGAVFKTTDGATSWTRVDHGLANMNITSLTVDPSAPSTVYAGTWNAGVFKSTDAGSTWNPTALRTEGEPLTPGIYSLAVDPAIPQIVYAGSVHHTFKSVDGGASWSSLESRSVSDRGALSIAIDLRNPSTIYVTVPLGFYRSDDRGTTWRQLEGDGGSVAVDARTNVVYRASRDDGFERSLDRGESWETLTNGLLSYPIIRFETARTTSRIFALALRGNYPQCRQSCGPLLRSDDRGNTWTDVTPAPLLSDFPNIGAIAIDPTSDSVVYVGLHGLLKSIDGGHTWAAAGEGLSADESVYVLAVDPASPATVYAGTSNGLYRSADGGAHFAPTGVAGVVTIVAIDPSNSANVYLGTIGFGLYRTSDRGATWSSVAGSPGPDAPGFNIWALAVDPTDSSVYVSTEDARTLRSENHGATWRSEGDGLPPGFTVQSFAFEVDPGIGTVYAGLEGSRIAESSTSRIRWSEIIPAPQGAGSRVATSPVAPGLLYAAGDGLFEGSLEPSLRRRPPVIPFR